MKTHASISAQEVHDHAGAIVQRCLKFGDYSAQCTSSVIISVLFFAAARVASISSACDSVRGAPSDETMRQAVIATLPEIYQLQQQINHALAADLPRALRRPQPLAIDLCDIAYHGQPQNDRREIRRGCAKAGTTHFHAYATAYVVRKGRRFTVALTYVRQDDSLQEVVKRLLRRVRRAGVSPRYLLLDRGFYSVDVIRYLQSARYSFLMPVKHAGRAPKNPWQAGSTRRFLIWKRSGWSEHTLENAAGRRATVSICVSCRNYAGRWNRHGRQCLVYAFWGLQPGSCRWVRDTYRKRFGIEASYRQMHQARIRTSTRDPVRRLLYVGIALILRNAWVWFHLIHLSDHLPGGGLHLHLDQLRLRQMLYKLQKYTESLLGYDEQNMEKQQE